MSVSLVACLLKSAACRASTPSGTIILTLLAAQGRADRRRLMLLRMQTTIDCELTIEEEGDGCCRQTLEGDVTINVMGLGRIAEKIICSSLHDVYSGIPEIVERCSIILPPCLSLPA